MFQSAPTITYFTLPKKHAGRVEPIRLCLEDAGIQYKLEEIPLDWTTWPKHKADLMSKGYACGTLPIMDLEGRKYSQTNAILTYLCRRLGKYLGNDIEEQYKVNQAADLCADWYTARIIAFVSGKDTYFQHIEGKGRHFLSVADALLSETAGPYLLGDKITFADFLLFQNARDEYTAPKLVDYPHIHALGKALVQRPNIQKYRPDLLD